MFNKRLVFAAACAGLLLFGIGLITLGSVVPDLRVKFKLNEVSSGTLFSIMPLGILRGSLIFGPICDKYGYKLLLIVSCVLIFIGFEGIAYSTDLTLLKLSVFFFAGLTVMRLLTGTVLRKMNDFTIMYISFGLIFVGLLVLKTSASLTMAMIALILLGAGLAGGFPIMLGIVGNRYKQLSGTAVSFVLVIALLGNMLVNYGMGIIAQHFGVQQVVNVALIELMVMIVFSLFIKRMTLSTIRNQ